MIAGAHTGTKFNDPLAIIALSPPFVTLLDNYGLRKHSVLKKHISIEIFFSQIILLYNQQSVNAWSQ